MPESVLSDVTFDIIIVRTYVCLYQTTKHKFSLSKLVNNGRIKELTEDMNHIAVVNTFISIFYIRDCFMKKISLKQKRWNISKSRKAMKTL